MLISIAIGYDKAESKSNINLNECINELLIC